MNIIVKQHTMMNQASDNKTAPQDNNSIQSAIIRSSLLITDNSSIAWDFFYKGSEVLFYQPDQNWLISDDARLNRRIAHTGEALSQLTKQYIEHTLGDKPETSAFSDRNNAQRVFSLASARRAGV